MHFNERFNLTEAIGRLSQVRMTEPISSLNEFLNVLKNGTLPPSEVLINIEVLVRNLIERQFNKPLLEAPNELIANGLDAQRRTDHHNRPLIVGWKSNCVIIKDEGDGIDLRTYFVPNRHNISEGIGRFGQGRFAALGFLIDQTSALLSRLPTIKDNELNLNLEIDGKFMKVNFRYDNGQVYTTIISQTVMKRKISVHTKRKNGPPLKIDFQETQGKIHFGIREESKKKPNFSYGTTIKITSPILEEEGPRILQHISKCFAFSKQADIIVNGKTVNQQQGFQTFKFEDVMLYYSLRENKKGVLRILEQGKLIVEIPCEGATVPEVMAIDFHHLPLSADRASLAYQDPETLNRLKGLIKAIFDSNLSSQQKSVILNGFHPFLDQGYFDLSESMLRLFKENDQCWPDIDELKPLAPKGTLFLHLKYLTTMPFRCNFESNKTKVYFIDYPIDSSIIPIKIDDVLHLLVDGSLMNEEDFAIRQFNLALIREWLKLKYDGKFELPPEFIEQFSPKSSSIFQTSLKSLPVLSYGEIKDPDQLLVGEVNYLNEFINEQKLHFENEELNTIYRNICTQKLQGFCTKKWAKFWYDLIKSNEEDFLNISEEDELVSLLADRVPYLSQFQFEEQESFKEPAEFIMQTSSYFFSLNEIDKINYMNILKSFLGNAHFGRIKFKGLFDKTKKLFDLLKEIVEESGSTDRDAINSIFEESRDHEEGISFFCNHKFITMREAELFLELLKKQTSQETKRKLLSYNHDIRAYSSSLMQIPNDELGELLTLIPVIYSVEYKAFFKVTQEDFFILKKYLLNIQISQTCKKNIAEIYFIFISALRAHVNFSREVFMKRLIYYFRFFNDEELNSFLKTVKNETTCLKEEWMSRVEMIDYHLFSRLESLLKEKKPIENQELRNLIESSVSQDFKSKNLPVLDDFRNLIISFFFSKYFEKFNPSPHNQKITNNNYLNLIAAFDVFQNDDIKPIFYLALEEDYQEEDDQAKTQKDFTFPSFPLIPFRWLHEDEDVVKEAGSIQDAKNRIKHAMNQNLRENFCIGEIIKNSKEAEATELKFEVFLNPNGLFMIVSDDGTGMGEKELKALKTPYVSTKRKGNEVKRNFGWGFSSVLEFFSAFISTVKDGTHSTLILDGEGEGIKIQTGPLELTTEKSRTKLILKKKNSEYPFVDYVKLKTDLMAICKHVKGIEISLNGICINGQKNIENSFTEIETPCYHQGQFKGMIKVRVGPREGGVYCDDLKMNSFTPQNYLTLLPSVLKEHLERVKFSIFLPQLEQVMNRAHIVEEDRFLTDIQWSVLKGAMQYILNRILNFQNYDELLSQDFWNDFRFFHIDLEDDTDSILRGIQSGLWQKCLNKRDYHRQKILIKAAEQYLKDQTNLHLPYFGNPSISEFIDSLNTHTKQNVFEKSKLKIMQQLEDPVEFAAVLTHLPLWENGPSLHDVRVNVEHGLHQIGILKEECYDRHFICSKTPMDLNNSLQECKKQLLIPGLEILLEKFFSQISNRIENIKKQQWEEEEEEGEEVKENSLGIRFLSMFLEKTSQKFWKKDIKVKSYSKPNGAIAEAVKDLSIMRINLLEAQPFIKIFNERISNIHHLLMNHSHTITQWLGHLAHEVTHMKENLDCEFSHDQSFRNQMCERFSTLFIRKSTENNIIHVLEELINNSKQFHNEEEYSEDSRPKKRFRNKY